MMFVMGGHAPDATPDATIVIFGAAVLPDGSPSTTLRARVDAAARFGRTRRAPLYIPTGGVGRFGASEASVMRDLLIAQGVSPDQVILEETATDTLSSVRAVSRMLQAIGPHGTLFAATSAYHLPRCRVLLRLSGHRTQHCPPPDRAAATRFTRRWYWRLREIPALPYDAVQVVALRLAGRL